MSAIDPITREVVSNALMSVADTMAVTVVRTARSGIIKHGMDFSTALFTADGQQVAQGLCLPAHLGAMEPALAAIRRDFEGDIKPDDIFVNNDPYDGGSHLPDIFVFKPIFVEDEVICWACAIGHQTDIGGRVPGGVVCDNTEIYQEGLLIPPLKLYAAGVRNDAIWKLLQRNVRVPDLVVGDVLALLAAVRTGEKEFLKVVAEYGKADLVAMMYDILDATEQRTRASIAKLPQGEWDFIDYVDHDGIEMTPIAIKSRVEISSDQVHVDFTGTSPQARGSISPNIHYTNAHVYAAFKCVLDEDINANSGYFRAFKVTAPAKSFVNPQHPTALAARGLAGFRVCQSIFGALAKAMPGRIPAAWGGGEIGLSFGGYIDDKAWVHLDLINDGPRGGGPDSDGADGLAAPIHNMANVPIESVEAEQPLRVECYELVPDTEGPGKHRGGLAIKREYRILADDTVLQLRSDRCDFAPWGIEGGGDGSLTHSYLNPETGGGKLPGKSSLLRLNKGDLLRVIQASGGGYGIAFERAPERVRRDVRQGKVTQRRARDVYGVVIGDAPDFAIDHKATADLRNQTL